MKILMDRYCGTVLDASDCGLPQSELNARKSAGQFASSGYLKCAVDWASKEVVVHECKIQTSRRVPVTSHYGDETWETGGDMILRGQRVIPERRIPFSEISNMPKLPVFDMAGSLGKVAVPNVGNRWAVLSADDTLLATFDPRSCRWDNRNLPKKWESADKIFTNDNYAERVSHPRPMAALQGIRLE